MFGFSFYLGNKIFEILPLSVLVHLVSHFSEAGHICSIWLISADSSSTHTWSIFAWTFYLMWVIWCHCKLPMIIYNSLATPALYHTFPVCNGGADQGLICSKNALSLSVKPPKGYFFLLWQIACFVDCICLASVFCFLSEIKIVFLNWSDLSPFGGLL